MADRGQKVDRSSTPAHTAAISASFQIWARFSRVCVATASLEWPQNSQPPLPKNARRTVGQSSKPICAAVTLRRALIVDVRDALFPGTAGIQIGLQENLGSHTVATSLAALVGQA